MRIGRVCRWALAAVSISACAAGTPALGPGPRPPALAGGVDTHLHLTMSHAAGPLFRGEPGDGLLGGDPKARWTNVIDGEALAASGVKLVYAALWPPFRARPGRSALGEALHQLKALSDFSRGAPASSPCAPRPRPAR